MSSIESRSIIECKQHYFFLKKDVQKQRNKFCIVISFSRHSISRRCKGKKENSSLFLFSFYPVVVVVVSFSLQKKSYIFYIYFNKKYFHKKYFIPTKTPKEPCQKSPQDICFDIAVEHRPHLS